MANISKAITNIVSITCFNRGKACQIFDSVRRSGTIVVTKNKKPECVLMSVDDYLSLMEEIDNARLLSIASERLANNNGTTISQEKMNNLLGITKRELDGFENVEIE